MNNINEEMLRQLLTLSPEDILELIHTAGVVAAIMAVDIHARTHFASALLGYSHKTFVLAGCQVETLIKDRQTGTTIHYRDGDRTIL